MDGRGGCCVARYGGVAGGGVYDPSKMSQILQRYRPIAPRPVTGGGSAVSGGAFSPVKVIKNGKGKRKYAGETTSTGSGGSSGSGSGSSSNNKRFNKRKKTSPSPVITLPLLPETPERKEMPLRNSSPNEDLDLTKIASQPYAPSPIWLSVNDNFQMYNPTVVVPQPVKIVGSSVTVECISDMWIDGNDIGNTDEEKVMNLEKDTCPGFISDGANKVTWTNRAYRSMVGGTSKRYGEQKIAVWLMMKEKECATVKKKDDRFTCKVKMQYTCKKEICSITLPCDVWKMECGGFAWRLDVKAALCLGR